METFAESPLEKSSFVEYDATGKVATDENFDPEAQIISQDFKRPDF
jgi:hypothetical protein